MKKRFLSLALMLTMAWAASAELTQVDGVYQIGTAQDLVDFSTGVNNKTIANNAKAALTADIDLTGINFTPIGIYADYGTKTQIRYHGNFNGQGHIIKNLYIDGEFDYECGLFSRPQDATIQNLGVVNCTIKNTYTNGGAITGVRAGVIGGEIYRCNINNVFAAGEISITTGFQEGGLAGEAAGGTNFRNCFISTGKISASQGNLTNSYQDLTAEDLASGKICYQLNKNAGSTIYYQTLGTDAYPVQDATHGTVYAQGSQMRCDGQVLSDDVTYANAAPTLPEHQFTDGFCTVCEQLDPDYVTKDANGNYQIGDEKQLKWFATYVNQKDQSINAVLTADIEGFTGPMIGESDSKPYTGTFDGQKHKINFEIGGISQVGGLFRNLAGTVKNLQVGGTLTIAQNVAGGLAGDLRGATVENIVVTTEIIGSRSGDAAYGGLAGRTMGGNNTIKNFVFAGKFTAPNANNSGGVIGWANSPVSISNTLVIGTFGISSNVGSSMTFSRNPGNVTLTNCYYLNALGDTQGATQVTEETLASGEVCYKLGDGWFQTIGTDDSPTPLGTDIVYFDGEAYTNTPALPKNEDGFYLIGSAAELKAFATFVAGDEKDAKGLQTANIDMSNASWTSLTAYAGTYDGDSFTIKNLGAPFCYSTEGNAAIKNLTLESDEPLVNTVGTEGFGAFIGLSNETGVGTTLIENCVNKTDVESNKKWVGGFIGATNKANKNSTTTIRNCQNLAAVSSESEAVAGFVGSHRLGMLVIENSTNSGNIAAGTAAAGGFIGQAQGNNSAEASFDISDCNNLGIITAGAERAGGLVGACYGLDKATFNRCWNEGAVTARTKRAAGIIGYLPNWTNKLTVTNCFNIAPITAENNAGAIVDLETKLWQASTIENCWNIGAVSGNGFSSTSNITRSNCYDLNGTGTGVEQVEADEVASGELTYKLNQGAGEFVFFQKDEYPQFEGDYVAKVADNGYGTFFVADQAIAAPDGVEAYTGKIEGDVLQMTAIEGTIPAGTAVVLKGEPGFYAFAPADDADAIAENDLQGTAAPVAADGTQYVLAQVEGKAVGFYQAQAETQIPFAKAFLTIAAEDPTVGPAEGVKGFRMVFGDATGINEMTTDNRQQTTVIYDLQGRRVVKATKGIYIVNGKKVLK